LVVVDVVNWLDRASASALAHVARRVSGVRVALIAAMRTGERTPFERGGLETCELQPLSDADAGALLQARFPSLAPRAREGLLAEAQGNPLALLELPIALNIRGGTSGALPGVLPLTERLERLFAGRIDHLPAATRDLLLLAVLDGTGDLAIISRGGQDLDALAPAERARVAYVDDTTGRLAFHHPIVRLAIVQRSTSSERRHAHEVLAERRRDDPERVAWHLAEAAIEPDEQVAALLEQVSHQYLRRGDAVAAIVGLLRAAQLSPSGDAPDWDESVGTLIAGAPSDAPQLPILPPQDGFLFLDREKFAHAFAADVPAREAAFTADSQVPLGVDAVSGTIRDPAWRSKPSWYLIVTEDRMIPPQQQGAMAERVGATRTEVPGNHAIYVSQPSAVAGLISQAARSLGSATSVA
jgi:hypothetical protein